MEKLNFKQFLEMNTAQVGIVATNPLPLLRPDYSAILPSVSRTSVVAAMEFNKNPIFILLKDGTRLYLSIDEFNRIKGKKPQIGASLTVVFQRSEVDKSNNTSKINSIICH